jgi:hypothetical protein
MGPHNDSLKSNTKSVAIFLFLYINLIAVLALLFLYIQKD